MGLFHRTNDVAAPHQSNAHIGKFFLAWIVEAPIPSAKRT